METKAGHYYARKYDSSMLLLAWVKPRLKVVGLARSCDTLSFSFLYFLLSHGQVKNQLRDISSELIIDISTERKQGGVTIWHVKTKQGIVKPEKKEWLGSYRFS